MVLVVFGGFCARTDAVVQKSYLGWVPIETEILFFGQPLIFVPFSYILQINHNA